MANPTTNFNWQMPTSSDLVTDLPADFEVFGQAVDTALVDLKGGTTNQILAKNSNTDMDFKWVSDATGMTNPMTTTGDTIYSSSGSTPARLGIGTAGQVLTVNSGATAPEWATAPAPASQTSIATGSLTGSSVTLSSISSAYRDLKLVITNFRPSSDLKLMMRFNGATSNYKATPGTYTASTNFADTELFISTTADGGASSQSLIVVNIPEYANAVAWKFMSYESLVNNETTNANGAWEQNAGLYKSTSAINSITLLPQAGGTFTTGDYVLYGVK